MVLLLRRFVAEAARIYEAKTGQSLEDALVIKKPSEAYDFLRPEMEHLDQEQLRTINLNARNRILSRSHLINKVPWLSRGEHGPNRRTMGRTESSYTRTTTA
jgi:DNA repair protein RadC